MNVEYERLMKNMTWELVPRPRTKRKHVNVLTSVWVLVIKRNEKGEVERFKARLAIRGFLQKFGIDCLQTYSPVVRIESVRSVMIIALMQGLDCRHVDFGTAFLNGELVYVDIDMEQPEGYDDGSGRVYHLLKGLYGLKQASKIWNDTLHAYLRLLNFQQCVFDCGVYYRDGKNGMVYVTVYVDDIVIAAKPSDIDIVVQELSAKFEIKDLGRVKHLLRMETNFEPDCLCGKNGNPISYGQSKICSVTANA
ncbi:polyprotein [Phytophthora megakarya]|uniref:Polyprotein n=1 Tax=Phytophthora megakarya TaxID=4795 RepID=A0A225USN9_9STRA|nr:polyprotein [Phytophthora megakarya]